LVVVLIDDRDGHRSICGRDIEDDSGATYSDDRTGRGDLHIARWRDLTSDKASRSLNQRKEGAVRATIGIVDELIQHEPRVGGQIQRASVIQHQPERRGAASLHNVVLVKRISGVDDDRYTVSNDAGATRYRDNMTDDFGTGSNRSGLGVRNVAR